VFESVFSCADCTHKAFVCAHCAQRAFLAEYVGLVCDNIHIAEYVGSFAEFIELFCDAQGSFAKYVQGLFCEICTRALLRNTLRDMQALWRNILGFWRNTEGFFSENKEVLCCKTQSTD